MGVVHMLKVMPLCVLPLLLHYPAKLYVPTQIFSAVLLFFCASVPCQSCSPAHQASLHLLRSQETAETNSA